MTLEIENQRKRMKLEISKQASHFLFKALKEVSKKNIISEYPELVAEFNILADDENPSYVFVEKDGHNYSGISERDKDVLNNKWICKNENYDHKAKNLTRFEKLTEKWEKDMDESYELIRRLQSAIKYCEIELGIIDGDNSNMAELWFKRCVKNIYEDNGDEILEILKEKPWEVMEIVLPRLRQKVVELRDYVKLRASDSPLFNSSV